MSTRVATCAWCGTWTPTVDNPCAYCGRDDEWEYTVESHPPRAGMHIGSAQGKCPSCGSTGLFVGSGGYLTCPWVECSDPTAPSKALGVVFPESK